MTARQHHTEERTMTDPMHCDRCGQAHAACTGHRRDGNPCKTPPMRGQTVCRMHGGATPAARAAAERRLEQTKAETALQRGLAEAYGDDVPDIDPGEAMLRAVSWKYAEVVALRRKVAELDDDARVWGTTRTEIESASALEIAMADGEVDSIGAAPGTKRIATAGANVWWQMLRSAEDQLVKFAAAARAAGCDERRVRLAEQQGDLVAGALRAILDALLSAMLEAGMAAALRDVWAQQVQVIVPRELRRLAAAGPV